MDTYIETKAYGKNAEDFLLAANEETVRLESVFSAKSEKSELYAVNNGSADPSAELKNLISEALALSELTDGTFDPALLSVSELWSFNGGARIPPADELASALNASGCEKITVSDSGIDLGGAKLDLGGIAKGYAADRFFAVAKKSKVDSAMGSFGGMVAAVGRKPNGDPWKIAIRNPKGDGYAAVLNASDVCISTSGGYERYFTFEGKTYHHILDPKTGYPAESDLLSATVIDPCGTKADALSTALFVMGEKNARVFCVENGVCAVLITEDSRIVPLGGAEELLSDVSDGYSVSD
ncbi:MAG: FAD:protein FMN transferase [Clostridia bacterium]|nr:FAD:protein FMN transferase [Clostridia bacterium]